MLINDALGGQASAADWAVQGGVHRHRNRHFRVLWSSKGGKTASLAPTDRFASGPGGAGCGLPAAALFRLCLACDVDPADRLLTVRLRVCSWPVKHKLAGRGPGSDMIPAP